MVSPESADGPLDYFHPSAEPKQFPGRQVIQGIVIAVVLGFVVALFLGTRNPQAQSEDFGAYYRAGQSTLEARPLYELDSHGPLAAYMYAPVFAFTGFRWLAHLPYLWAVRVFMAINWIATFVCVWLCLRLMKTPGRDLLILGLIAIVPTGDYLKANIHNGQVGTMLLLACIGWLTLMLSGRSFLGGLLLSIPVALKLYPAILVPYLLLRKDWRGVAGVAIGSLLLFGIPAIFVGLHELIPLHIKWLKFCMSTQIANQTIRTGNQSLLGVLARLPFITNGNQQLISQADLDKLMHIYPIILIIITALVYGLILISKRNPVRDVALLLLWMTIASPRAWTFNFAVEILPAMLLAAVIVDRRPGSGLEIAALLCAPIALMFPTNLIHFSQAWSLGAYLLQNKHFDAAVIMGFALAIQSDNNGSLPLMSETAPNGQKGK
jgi:hypothetical protein